MIKTHVLIKTTFSFVLVGNHFNKEPNHPSCFGWFQLRYPPLAHCRTQCDTTSQTGCPLLAQREKITNWGLYLIVQVKVIKLAVGPEVLSVVIQSEVDVPPVALYDNWVPVVVVQQAPTGHSGVTLDRSMLVAACTESHTSHWCTRYQYQYLSFIYTSYIYIYDKFVLQSNPCSQEPHVDKVSNNKAPQGKSHHLMNYSVIVAASTELQLLVHNNFSCCATNEIASLWCSTFVAGCSQWKR